VVATKMQAEIRDTDQSDFPDVARFHDLHDRGELITPEEAASRIWKTIEDGVEPGSVVDVRLDSAR
jgi:benzil reductase ((S)-benzoin forming)